MNQFPPSIQLKLLMIKWYERPSQQLAIVWYLPQYEGIGKNESRGYFGLKCNLE